MQLMTKTVKMQVSTLVCVCVCVSKEEKEDMKDVWRYWTRVSFVVTHVVSPLTPLSQSHHRINGCCIPWPWMDSWRTFWCLAVYHDRPEIHSSGDRLVSSTWELRTSYNTRYLPKCPLSSAGGQLLWWSFEYLWFFSFSFLPFCDHFGYGVLKQGNNYQAITLLPNDGRLWDHEE